MTLHPGEQLDHYRIEGLVARSGMASIFRATDMRTVFSARPKSERSWAIPAS
jgi:hypothetical protein